MRSPLAWRKSGNSDILSGSTGKCLPDLSQVLVPGTRPLRLSGGAALDLTIAINRLPPGPMLELGREFQSLLIIPNHPTLMARYWAGQWDQAAVAALRPEIANCTRKQIKAVLGHIGRISSSTATACWRVFLAMARELSPRAARPSTISGRANVHHWMGPSLGRGPRINTEIPTPCFVSILIELAI